MLIRICCPWAAICVLAALGPAQAPDRVASVPFEGPREHLILVDGTVGSERVTLLLDTGTSRTVLDRRTAARIAERGSLDWIVVFGQRVPAERIHLPSLRIGSVQAAGLSVLAADLSGIGERLGRQPDAIVGLDVLRGRCLIVDYANRLLRFGCTNQWAHSVPGDRGSPYFVVPAAIDGREYRLLVDTGSDALAIFERAAAHVLDKSDDLIAADDLLGTVRLRYFTAESVRLGGVRLPGHPTVVVVPGTDGDRGYDGLLGVRRLSSRVQLDLERMVLGW